MNRTNSERATFKFNGNTMRPSRDAMKTSNTSVKPKKVPNKADSAIKTYQTEMMLDMFTLRERPISLDYMEKLALEWITAVLADEDMVTINRYPLRKGINTGTLSKWYDRSLVLKQAHDHIVDIIADRREHGAMHNKLNAAVFLKTQHMFSKGYEAAEIWRANLAAKVAGAGGGITLVEYERFPSSDKVPVRGEE